MSVPKQVSSNLLAEEKILYDQSPYAIARLQKGPDYVYGAVITNKRIIFYNPYLNKVKNFRWQDIRNVNITEGLLGGELEFEMIRGNDAEILYMSKSALKNIYTIVTELVAKAHEKPIAVTFEDPVAKLKQLKEMLDGGLISQSEYDSTKKAILTRM